MFTLKKISRKILLLKCLFIRIAQTDNFIIINLFIFTGRFLNFEFVNMFLIVSLKPELFLYQAMT